MIPTTKKSTLARLAVRVALCFLLALSTALAVQDDLLAPYESGDRFFIKVEVGGKIVFFHQRMLGEAIVEKDFIRYQFDRDTRLLIEKEVIWRDDLPEQAVETISEAEALAAVEGEALWATLYVISPESDVFPLTAPPTHPCWVVRNLDPDGNLLVSVIDGLSGELIGEGIAPPAGGFSLSGPQYWNPCRYSWTSWYQNAENWFNSMGYPTVAVKWPVESIVKSHVQKSYTSAFYELAHGGSSSFCSGCASGNTCDNTTAADVKSWITDSRRMPFTFIGSCGGMCDIGPNSLSHEFRKGSSRGTVTVGYCGMGSSHCELCWGYSVPWQDDLFKYASQGKTIKQAFDAALANYPVCAANPACMRFAGDAGYKLTGWEFEFCFEDSWRKEFDTDGLWLVGDGSNLGCGRSDLIGWAVGDFFVMNWDIDTTSPCTESVFYFGHTYGLSYNWINTHLSTGKGVLESCTDDTSFPEGDADELQPSGAAFTDATYCFIDNFGYRYDFDFDGYYLYGEAKTDCGTVPLIGAAEAGLFSWYLDVPSGTPQCNEGMLYAGIISFGGGLCRATDGNTALFGPIPCPPMDEPVDTGAKGPLSKQ